MTFINNFAPMLANEDLKSEELVAPLENGKVTAETDENLLFFLSYHEGILPRLARGCVILCTPGRYVFCYVSVSPSPKNQFVVWDYCPPKEGGQFVICLLYTSDAADD